MTVTRERVLETLEQQWRTYISQYQALAPAAQADFLKRQGFPRFQDLLAHVIAWWDEGISVISSVRDDPYFVCRELDTDAFNAEAVKQFGKFEEAEIFRRYEATRLKLLGLVGGLTEAVLNKPDVQDWLEADVIEHYDEHAV